MTKTECAAKIRELCASYNEVLEREVVDKNALDAIETQAKETAGKAKAAAKAELYAELDKSSNPMLEAARTGVFSYDGYELEKEEGVVVAMNPAVKVATIKAADYTSHLMKLGTDKTKNAKYPQNGVFVNGHKWEYMCEKLGLLLAYRALKELGGDQDALQNLMQNYVIRDAAQKEKAGATPTSNSQLLKLVQPIIDALVWVDDGKGNNQVKANGKDVAFLVNCFTSHGKGIGTVKVLAGKKVMDYLFEAVHMIVTGKPYELQYKVKKDATPVETVRKPIEVSKPAEIEKAPAAEAPAAE